MHSTSPLPKFGRGESSKVASESDVDSVLGLHDEISERSSLIGSDGSNRYSESKSVGHGHKGSSDSDNITVSGSGKILPMEIDLSTDYASDKDIDGDGERDIDLTEEEYNCLKCTSVVSEVYAAFYSARYMLPLMVALALFLAYRVVVIPSHVAQSHQAFGQDLLDHSEEPLGVIRPLLGLQELLDIQTNTLHGETKFWLPSISQLPSSSTSYSSSSGQYTTSKNYQVNPNPSTVKLRFYRYTSNYKDGNFRPPDLFYNGVVFSLTDSDSHKLEFVSRRDLAATDLLSDINNMVPKPTYVMKRTANYNVTEWYEEGYAVYFSFDDLKIKNRIGYEYSEEFENIKKRVIEVARAYRLVYVTMWYPHTFGDLDLAEEHHQDEYGELSPWVFTNIIQQTIPTRTGLNELKSTCVVWLSAVDDAPPKSKERVVAKNWGPEGSADHWTTYRQSSIPEEERMQPLKIKNTRVVYDIDANTYGEFVERPKETNDNNNNKNKKKYSKKESKKDSSKVN